jgi:hypothetical protein
MESFMAAAAAALRRAVSNGATGDSSAAAIDTDSDDEDFIHDTTSSDDVSDATSDDEEEDTTWRSVVDEDQEKEEEEEQEEEEEEEEKEKEQEEEEEEEEDGNADDGFNSSKTNVFLGVAGVGRPGSAAYRKTVQRLAKTYGPYWNDKLFNRLLEQHKPKAFRIKDQGNGRWRKASVDEIKKSAKLNLKYYREKHHAATGGTRGGGGKKRKSYPKAACSYDEDKLTDDDAELDFDVYESDQDKKPSATKQKAAKVQKVKKRSPQTPTDDDVCFESPLWEGTVKYRKVIESLATTSSSAIWSDALNTILKQRIRGRFLIYAKGWRLANEEEIHEKAAPCYKRYRAKLDGPSEQVAKKARTSSTHDKKKPAGKTPVDDDGDDDVGIFLDTFLSQLLAREITAFNSEDVNVCEKGADIKKMITLIKNGRAKLKL